MSHEQMHADLEVGDIGFDIGMAIASVQLHFLCRVGNLCPSRCQYAKLVRLGGRIFTLSTAVTRAVIYGMTSVPMVLTGLAKRAKHEVERAHSLIPSPIFYEL